MQYAPQLHQPSRTLVVGRLHIPREPRESGEGASVRRPTDARVVARATKFSIGFPRDLHKLGTCGPHFARAGHPAGRQDLRRRCPFPLELVPEAPAHATVAGELRAGGPITAFDLLDDRHRLSPGVRISPGCAPREARGRSSRHARSWPRTGPAGRPPPECACRGRPRLERELTSCAQYLPSMGWSPERGSGGRPQKFVVGATTRSDTAPN